MLELTAKEKDILEMLDRGIATREVGKKYRVSQERIYQIKKKARWKLNIINAAREELTPDTDVCVFGYAISGKEAPARFVYHKGIRTIKDLAEFNGDFRGFRNVGEKRAVILEYLRDKARDVLEKGEEDGTH